MLHRLGLAATLAGSLLIALAGGIARADDDHPARCDVPLGDWQPRAAVEAALQERGWTVLSVRSDDGCYKVKVRTETGEKRRVKLDPKTLEPVDGED
ncbi:PepSY domain-containing protein [Pleomorphomonas sp. JP5]|uniref:PepSY domain-containing protein n=1 Tax=Pleomorphomonas sp. JP5 TaxID=2942998 RepID=UPI00204378B0|nr:PepSY domain-containing protein [Pleomorphomonas sp. JP5]MCM5557169.1 PepSY domain-containing protein [Pleomorphomonas sp. JP5]